MYASIGFCGARVSLPSSSGPSVDAAEEQFEPAAITESSNDVANSSSFAPHALAVPSEHVDPNTPDQAEPEQPGKTEPKQPQQIQAPNLPATKLAMERWLPALPPSQESFDECVEAIRPAAQEDQEPDLAPPAMTLEECKKGMPYNKYQMELLRGRLGELGAMGRHSALKVDGSIRWMDIVRCVGEASAHVSTQTQARVVDSATFEIWIHFVREG